MVRVDDMLREKSWRDDAHLLLQVHDELVYEVTSEQVAHIGRAIKQVMESVLKEHETHGVPIQTVMKTGANWGLMEA